MPFIKSNLLKVRYLLKKYLKPVFKHAIPQKLWINIKKILNRNRPSQQMGEGIEKVFSDEWSKARIISNQNAVFFKGLPGVNLVGYFQAATGLGQAVRGCELGLEAAGIPLEKVDFQGEVPAWQKIEFNKQQHTVPTFKYKTNIFHVNPPQLPFLWDAFDNAHLVGRYNIGIWYWELPKFPIEWTHSFRLVDEVWGATNFICDAVREVSPVPVVRIPPVVQVKANLDIRRDRFQLPDNKFLFLCAYDVLSSHVRKNPQAAIQAFKRAFPKPDQNVGMVIKINNSQENAEGVQLLKNELIDFSNCYFIEDILSRKEFVALLNLADAYVSLHHSEGFGLIPAESMALGKPVVMTHWSGNIDFMTAENSCPVDFRLVPVGQADVCYQPDQLWADPDIDQAAYYMKKLYFDNIYYKKLSVKAQEHIQLNYSAEVIGKKIFNRLFELGLIG